MRNFKIIPITKAYAERIKATGNDDQGNAIIETIATGKGPCRVSLKPFLPGVDKRVLISHSPFEKTNAFNQPGPIFINSEVVEEYSDIYRFPIELKADKKSFPLTLIGYN